MREKKQHQKELKESLIAGGEKGNLRESRKREVWRKKYKKDYKR